jgi:hypothetical protein
MKSKLKKHPMGFMYEEIKDGSGRISVSCNETKRYLVDKPIYFDGIDDSEDDWLIRFTDSIKSGKYFYKVDMFGKNYILEKDELIDFIEEYYNPTIEEYDEPYISICSKHLINKL